MSEANTIENQANLYAKRFILLCLVTMIVVLPVYYTQFLKPLRIPVAYCLLVAMAYAMYLIIAIYRTGTGGLPILPFIVGMVFIVGGVAFDVIATVTNNPSLSREANPIARPFLDLGYPVKFVYAYGLLAQSMFTLMSCMMWATFLRHYKHIITLAWQLNPKTSREFIIAAMRGEGISQWLWGLRLSDYRNYNKWYRPAVFLCAGFVAVPVTRLYLGLEWFGLPYIPPNTLVIIAMLLAVMPYYTWLWIEYSEGQKTGKVSGEIPGRRAT